MKLYRHGILLILLIFMVAGCGKYEINSTPIETKQNISKKKIVFSTHRVDKVTELNRLADEFMKKNPDTLIEIEPIADLDRIYKARLAVNELPDITAITGLEPNSPDYFAPLNDLGFTSDDFALPLPMMDGNIYSLPIGVSYDGVVYNKSVFKKAGIAKAPTTMKEFMEVCKKLKEAGVIPLALNAKSKWPTTWFVRRYPKMKLDNPQYEVELAESDKLLSPDSPVFNILKNLRDMYKQGYLEPDITQTDWEQMKKDMAKGKVAMTFLGSWLISQLTDNGAKPDEIGMFPFPEIKCIYLDNDVPYSISNRSKHIDVAKAFMKYLWQDSKISNAIGQASPFKNSDNELNAVKELLSFNIPAKFMGVDESRYSEVIMASRIDINSVCYEYIFSDTPEKIINDYNERWKAGREKIHNNSNYIKSN
ncbi:MAG: extracellular solute-binding protein [Bacillota bacterium]|nr:extracellular solute-binding protein [Bacillota bacterium]